MNNSRGYRNAIELSMVTLRAQDYIFTSLIWIVGGMLV